MLIKSSSYAFEADFLNVLSFLVRFGGFGVWLGMFQMVFVRGALVWCGGHVCVWVLGIYWVLEGLGVDWFRLGGLDGLFLKGIGLVSALYETSYGFSLFCPFSCHLPPPHHHHPLY